MRLKELETSPLVVGICTFRRAEHLVKLLRRIGKIRRRSGMDVSCVIVDNDCDDQVRKQVEETSRQTGIPCQYHQEKSRNFARVRNRILDQARGKYLAFIDDDELPSRDWLIHLHETLIRHEVAGVMGPVRPYFNRKPPRWLTQSGICERREHATGHDMHGEVKRTGNVLLDLERIREQKLRFDERFGSGGEDVDFFQRAVIQGNRFVWCNEAPVYELVPDERQTLRYHLKRAFLQGGISAKYAENSGGLKAWISTFAKSAVALVVYAVCLPVWMLSGWKGRIKMLVKCSHHIGRLATITRLKRKDIRKF